MFSLNDVKAKMSALYSSVESGVVDLRTASELANIAGKYLKAEQLDLAREIFLAGRLEPHRAPHDLDESDARVIRANAARAKLADPK